jgi:hypothetical protein
VSAGDHGARLRTLTDRLAYMTPDNLQTLAEVILENASGNPPAWPSEALVMQWAHAIQAAPPRERRIVTSWLASVEGPVAEAGGYLVELLRWLRRHRRPLTPNDLKRVRVEAADMQGRLLRIRERIAKGVPWPDDHDTLSVYLADLAQARQFVQSGVAKRAAQGPAQGNEGQAA